MATASLKYTLSLLLAATSAGGITNTAQAADAKLSPIDRLIAEDEIRQDLALYALLADGDGIKGKDTRTLADKMMAPDVVTEIYYPLAKAPLKTLGREAVAGPAPVVPAVPAPVESTIKRHYLVETYFEDLTATTAKTITTAVHFNLTRNLVGQGCAAQGPGACGGIPARITMWVYHMTWAKTAAGWQVTYNGLHMDN